MSILPGTKAPWFSSVGFQDGKFYDISLTDFSSAGQWLLLFFYPVDFGYVSPSELLEMEAKRPELEKLGCRYEIFSWYQTLLIMLQASGCVPGQCCRTPAVRWPEPWLWRRLWN